MSGKPTTEELSQQQQLLEEELSVLKELSRSDTSKLHYLEDILNNANTPVFLKRSDFKYLFVNREFERLGRITGECVEGKDDFTLFPKPVAELFRSQDEEVLSQKKIMEFEETIALHDGIHTFITAKFPLFDVDGNIDAIAGICTDITPRKKAEAKLKEAEEKYRSIIDNSPLGILQIGHDGTITTCNEKLAAILKSNVDKIVGLNLLDCINDSRVQSAVSYALSGRTVQYEGWYQSFTSGNRAYLRGIFSPIVLNDGSIQSAIGIVEDNTDRKNAEDALQKAREDLEKLVLERTAELAEKNKKLRETNIALEILLEKRDADKQHVEERILENINKLIRPYLDKLILGENVASREVLLKLIQSNLDEITSSFIQAKSILSTLTPTQMQIADLIKHGHNTKEIAQFLNLSPSTISCHRQEIRKRLNLTNRKINLQAALSNKS